MKTFKTFIEMKARNEKITMLTVYDAIFAQLIDQVGADILFVGDSLGNTVQGHDSTLPVTVKDMIYHTQCVRRGSPKAFVLSDLPFMSYTTVDQALKNSAKLMQAGANMIKLEGGSWLVPIISALKQHGVPSCVHMGLTPQSVHGLGGYKVQGRDEHSALAMLEDAVALEAAGAQMLVLECVPRTLGKEIALGLTIPVIGIGAGPDCDGQVLVIYDMLGLSPGKPFKFTKNFMSDSNNGVFGALEAYHKAVKEGTFPTDEQSFA